MAAQASRRVRAHAIPMGVVLGVSTAACGVDAEGLFDASRADARAGDVVAFDANDRESGPAIADNDAAIDDTGTAWVDVDDTLTPAVVDATLDALDGLDGLGPRPNDATLRETSSGPPVPVAWDGGAIADSFLFDADWTTFCVALAGCGQFPSISACMARMHQPGDLDVLVPSPTLVQCVGNAGASCTAIAQCLNDGSKCNANGRADVCTGSSLATCRWGFLMTTDCADLGMSCTSGRSNAGCGFGDCAPWQEGATYCAGRFVVTCDRGRYTPTLDCQAFGAKCGGSPGAAECQAVGAPCPDAAPAVSTCRGARLEACLAGHVGSANCLVLYDPQAGFACFVDPASQAARCAKGTDCSPATYNDTCSDSQTVAFCNAGALDLYDCSNGWASGCVNGRCSN